MISEAVINKVFDAAPIEEVVGEYVTLKRAGANFKGLCPFHDDKNPSMSVSPSKGIYKCFSCGKGGNSVQFIMEHEGLSYPLAIKFLADRYNIEIEEGQINVGELEEEARKKDGVFSCLEFAKNHFYQSLNNSQQGKVIYKPYLMERGVSQLSIDKFHIGLSGLSHNEFMLEGLKNGYTTQQMYDAGLVKKIDEDQGIIESNLRDTFMDRIVFPIYNVAGKVLGFGGRIIKKETKAPKYLNSPETIVYEKRKQLFGLNFAKNETRITDNVYLVEGYMDVVSLYQNGIENVIAASGTAFTPEQARLIKRFAGNITLLFDGDEAGIKATLKHISTLLEANLNVTVALFPENEDPDSYIQEKGKSAFLQYVEDKAQNFVELIISLKTAGKPNDPIKKAEAAREIAENLSIIPDALKRAAYIGEAAELLNISEQIIIQEANKFRVRNRKQGERQKRVEDYVPQPLPLEQDFAPPKDETNYQELELLKTLMLYADRPFDEERTVAQFMFDELEIDEVWPVSDEIGPIFKDAYAYWLENKVLNELYFIRNPKTTQLAASVLSVKYALSKGWETNFDKFVKQEEDNYKEQVKENLNYLKIKHIDLMMLENQESIKNAEDDEEVMNCQLMHQRLQELRKKITDEIGTVIVK